MSTFHNLLVVMPWKANIPCMEPTIRNNSLPNTNSKFSRISHMRGISYEKPYYSLEQYPNVSQNAMHSVRYTATGKVLIQYGRIIK